MAHRPCLNNYTGAAVTAGAALAAGAALVAGAALAAGAAVTAGAALAAGGAANQLQNSTADITFPHIWTPFLLLITPPHIHLSIQYSWP